MVRSSSPTCDFHSSPMDAVHVSHLSDNNLQSFFILHKAPARKCERKSSFAYGRTKRNIDMPLSSRTSAMQEEKDAVHEQLRLEAFEITWSKIDSAIKDVLREMNVSLFKEIHHWIFESFSTIRSTSPVHIMKPYPITIGVTCKRIPVALVFTKNIEFVDDLLMFQDLKGYMQSNGCHAAFLSALDISIKHDETERCDGTVLADFIKMLSEWVMKIPIIFILGVTTTFDAIRKLLPISVMHNLQICNFTLESPGRRMDSVIESVLVRSCSGFFIGHKVALFLRNHFVRCNGTITSFLKALKLACIKHFTGVPISFLCPGMLREDSEDFWSDRCESLSEVLRSYAFDLPSCQRGETIREKNLAQGLSKLKWLQNSWSSVVLCLFEVGKLSKMQLLDIFCEAIDPSLCGGRALGQHLLPPSTASYDSDAKTCFVNGGFISQAIQKVREVPSESLCHLLGQWCLHMEEVIEMNKEVKELHSMIKLLSDGQASKERTVNVHGKFLVPIESIPFHEIFCFKDVASLKSALIGDPRRVIQDDLLKSDEHLRSTSCNRKEYVLSSSSHDTAIMYSLAQEYGDLINLHDWYHSFKTKVLIPGPKAKRKVKHSPASKKQKSTSLENEVSIQARFCKAVTELQITGLVRMPSKRRPDFLQRIAFDF